MRQESKKRRLPSTDFKPSTSSGQSKNNFNRKEFMRSCDSMLLLFIQASTKAIETNRKQISDQIKTKKEEIKSVYGDFTLARNLLKQAQSSDPGRSIDPLRKKELIQGLLTFKRKIKEHQSKLVLLQRSLDVSRTNKNKHSTTEMVRMTADAMRIANADVFDASAAATLLSIMHSHLVLFLLDSDPTWLEGVHVANRDPKTNKRIRYNMKKRDFLKLRAVWIIQQYDNNAKDAGSSHVGIPKVCPNEKCKAPLFKDANDRQDSILRSQSGKSIKCKKCGSIAMEGQRCTDTINGRSLHDLMQVMDRKSAMDMRLSKSKHHDLEEILNNEAHNLHFTDTFDEDKNMVVMQEMKPSYKRLNHFRECIKNMQGLGVVKKETMEIIKSGMRQHQILPEKFDMLTCRKLLKKLKLSSMYNKCVTLCSKINPDFNAMNLDDKTKARLCLMFCQVESVFCNAKNNVFLERKNFLSYNHTFFRLCDQIGRGAEAFRCVRFLKSKVLFRKQETLWNEVCKNLNWNIGSRLEHTNRDN
eukprot:jgi/Bigna1/129967/aug1.10_g4675